MARISLAPDVPPDLTSEAFGDWLHQWNAEHNDPAAIQARAQALQPEPDTAYLQTTGYCLTARGKDYLEMPDDGDDGDDAEPLVAVAYL